MLVCAALSLGAATIMSRAPGPATPATRVVSGLPSDYTDDPATWEPPAPPGPAPEPILPSIEHWYAIGRCEQPGTGDGGVDWDAGGARYQGGLGISTGAWQGFSAGLPSSAFDATPIEQMLVASRIWLAYGDGAWGCRADP